MLDFKKNFIYNILLTLTNILFPIVTFPYVSRILGPQGIGTIQFVVSFAQYFALFAGLGIPIYGVREIAKYKNDKQLLSKTFSELIIIHFLTSLILSMIYLVIIFSFDHFAADRKLYLFSTSLILFGFSSIDWLYSGLEGFKLISLRSVAVKIISVISVFLFIKSSADHVIFLYISIFSVLANNIFNLLFLPGKASLKISGSNFKKHVKPLLYIFSTTVATSMYTVLDNVLLGLLSSEKAVGYYTAAVKLTKISLPFITSTGAVTLPALAEGFHGKDESIYPTLQKIFDFIIFFSVPISVGSFLMAYDFIIAFSGTDFLPALIPMQIMSVLPVLIGLGFFYGFQVLVPASKDKELLYSVLIGMVLGVSVNIVLVPLFGASGGALANVLTELIVTSAYIYFVRKNELFKPKLNVLYQTLLSSIVFVPVYFISKNFEMGSIVRLAFVVPLCGLLYALFQGFLFKNPTFVGVINKFTERIFAK